MNTCHGLTPVPHLRPTFPPTHTYTSRIGKRSGREKKKKITLSLEKSAKSINFIPQQGGSTEKYLSTMFT